jgi:hypothetical protein
VRGGGGATGTSVGVCHALYPDAGAMQPAAQPLQPNAPGRLRSWVQGGVCRCLHTSAWHGCWTCRRLPHTIPPNQHTATPAGASPDHVHMLLPFLLLLLLLTVRATTQPQQLLGPCSTVGHTSSRSCGLLHGHVPLMQPAAGGCHHMVHGGSPGAGCCKARLAPPVLQASNMPDGCLATPWSLSP